MTAYATPADLARVATEGWPELAQRASTSRRVDGDLLRAVAEGADTGAWSAEAVADAQAALAVLQDSLARVSRYADSFLAPRYPLPLSAALIQSGDLVTAISSLAWRRLYGASLPEEVAKATAWAETYLRDLSAGRASLGAADTAVAQPPGRMKSRAPAKTIDWGAY